MNQNFKGLNRVRSHGFVLAALFFFSVASLCAQTTISGTTSDDQGVLPGVNVLVKGTTVGSVSDFDGNYSIEAPDGSSTLVFSYVGYSKQEVAIDGRTTINVTLTEDAQALSEVVVVGYGTQKKGNLTGAVGSIGAEEIGTKPLTSPDQALAGTIAGVNIANRSGDPAAPINVRIRGVGSPGNNDPLWVIDGIPLVQTTNITVNTSSTTDSNPLASLNPNDIESITVLKDAASAAIYGARGANGVIMVTTKRGKSGVGKMTYSGYTAFSELREKIDVLNVSQYIDIQSQLGRDYSGFANSREVDWQDEFFKTGFVQSHNISASGGNENANYYISGGYLDQEGIEQSQAFERYSLKANSDFKVGKRLKFGQSLAISHSDRQVQPEGGGVNSAGISLRNAPYYQPFDINGPLGYNIESIANIGAGNGSQNTLWRNDPRVNLTTIEVRQVLGNFYGELELAEGLKAKASVGVDHVTGEGLFNQTPANFNGTGARQSLRVQNLTKQFTLTTGATLSYNKTFGESHNFSALVGFEQTKFTFDKIRVQGTNIFNPNFATTSLNSTATQEADLWTLQGWLGRVNYDYEGKYLATINFRRDASSRFAEDNRSGVFPSVSLGWRISSEEFFNTEGVVNDLKIRAGWGQLGNQQTPDSFPYQPALESNIFYVIGDDQTVVRAPAPTRFANAALGWETSTQFDIGLDASLFQSRMSITADYYNKESDDVLLAVPLPSVSGIFYGADSNLGSIKNSGVELAVDYRGEVGDHFTYSIGANITTVKNEVTDLGDVTAINSGIGGAQTHRTVVGESLGHFYGYKTNGLYQNTAEAASALPDASSQGAEPGDIRFVDVNGDGEITPDDRTILGSPIPGYFYGMNFNANYKNFDFALVFRGVGDLQVYNSARSQIEDLRSTNNFSTRVLNRWTGEGTSNDMPRLTLDDPNQNNRYSDRWIEDADYLRIQNLQIGYNIPGEDLGNWTGGFINGLRIYFGASNLATFTSYKGWDPEVTRAQSFQKGANALATGQDGGTGPAPRTYQIGLTVNF
ncbi:SusC/RagA family TonB-linked outer membrane protein [Zobellia uliginosa]|uniref:SusC/RagA family TonB-linked outer membrane protein n=1 Tax=Zobellia uliginosa TaxID=143224 RepID=UPI001C074B0A|nr:TonB-dependent receptor [Zobellia uliginosa]MBU2948578.1 TonB-dependent receptor [Zobellia uliginosa]